MTLRQQRTRHFLVAGIFFLIAWAITRLGPRDEVGFFWLAATMIGMWFLGEASRTDEEILREEEGQC